MSNEPAKGGNQFELTRTISRATVTLLPHQIESLAIEFYGKVLEGTEDEYVVEFTAASHVAEFMVALRSFTRK